MADETIPQDVHISPVGKCSGYSPSSRVASGMSTDSASRRRATAALASQLVVPPQGDRFARVVPAGIARRVQALVCGMPVTPRRAHHHHDREEEADGAAATLTAFLAQLPRAADALRTASAGAMLLCVETPSSRSPRSASAPQLYVLYRLGACVRQQLLGVGELQVDHLEPETVAHHFFAAFSSKHLTKLVSLLTSFQQLLADIAEHPNFVDKHAENMQGLPAEAVPGRIIFCRAPEPGVLHFQFRCPHAASPARREGAAWREEDSVCESAALEVDWKKCALVLRLPRACEPLRAGTLEEALRRLRAAQSLPEEPAPAAVAAQPTLASLLLAAPPSEPQDHSQLQSHGVSPSTTGANTPAPSEESSTARHVAVVEAAPLLPPKEILTQLRMSQPSVRRRALRSLVGGLGSLHNLQSLPLSPTQQSEWAALAPTLLEAVVRMVADGLADSEEADAGGSAQTSPSTPGPGGEAGLTWGGDAGGGGAGGVLSVLGRPLLDGAGDLVQERAPPVLAVGLQRACTVLLKAHPSAAPRFVGAMLAAVRAGKAEQLALYQLLVAQLALAEVRSAVVNTGGMDLLLDLYLHFTARLQDELPRPPPSHKSAGPPPVRVAAALKNLRSHKRASTSVSEVASQVSGRSEPHLDMISQVDEGSRHGLEELVPGNAHTPQAGGASVYSHRPSQDSTWRTHTTTSEPASSGPRGSPPQPPSEAVPRLNLSQSRGAAAGQAPKRISFAEGPSSSQRSARLRSMAHAHANRRDGVNGTHFEGSDSDSSSEDMDTPREAAEAHAQRVGTDAFEDTLPSSWGGSHTSSSFSDPPPPLGLPRPGANTSTRAGVVIPKLSLPQQESSSRVVGGLTRSTRRSSHRSARSALGVHASGVRSTPEMSHPAPPAGNSSSPSSTRLLHSLSRSNSGSQGGGAGGGVGGTPPLWQQAGDAPIAAERVAAASAIEEMAQVAKEIGEAHLLGDLTALIAHRRYAPKSQAVGGVCGPGSGSGGARRSGTSRGGGSSNGGNSRRSNKGNDTPTGGTPAHPTSTVTTTAGGVVPGGRVRVGNTEALVQSVPYQIKCALLQAFAALGPLVMGGAGGGSSVMHAAAARNPVNIVMAELAAGANRSSPLALPNTRLRRLAIHVLRTYTLPALPVGGSSALGNTGRSDGRRSNMPRDKGSNGTFATSRSSTGSQQAGHYDGHARRGVGRADAVVWRVRARLAALLPRGAGDAAAMEELEGVLSLLSSYLDGCALRHMGRHVIDVLGDHLLRAKHLLLGLGRFSGWRSSHLRVMSAYLAAADALANLPGVDQLLAELLMAVMFQGETGSQASVPAHSGFGWVREYASHVLFSETVMEELPDSEVAHLRLRIMRHFRVLVALAGRALPRSPSEKEGATARFSEASSRLTARSQLMSREDALMLLKFLMDPYQGFCMRLLESAAGAAGSPLRFEILSLLEEVFSTEGCPYLHEKRVVDFYIRFHYLAFVKLYVPYAPERGAHGDPRECTLHLKVLRAFAGNKNSLVKRRFHQLRIMDFLIREIDLEFEVSPFLSAPPRPSSAAPHNKLQDSFNTPAPKPKPALGSPRVPISPAVDRQHVARSPSRHSSRAQSDTRRARSEDDDAHEGGVAFTGDLNEDVEALEAAEDDLDTEDDSETSFRKWTPTPSARGPVIPKLNLGQTPSSAMARSRLGTPKSTERRSAEGDARGGVRGAGTAPSPPASAHTPAPAAKTRAGWQAGPGGPSPTSCVPSLSLAGLAATTPPHELPDFTVPLSSNSNSSDSSDGKGRGFTGDLNEDVEMLEAEEGSGASDDDKKYQLYDSDSDASSVARSPPGAARSQPVVPKLCFNLGGVRSAAMSSGVSSAAASSRRGASPQTTPGGRRQSTSRSRSKARSSSHNLARVPSSLPAVPKLALGSALRRNGGGRSGVASPITPALDATSAAPVAGTGGTGLSQMEESLDFDPGCLKLHQVLGERRAALVHAMGAHDEVLRSNSWKGVEGGDEPEAKAELEAMYAQGRKHRRLYQDRELHLLVLEMILGLMMSEEQDLDPLYCDQFPIEKRKHNIPFLLYLHVNHPSNEGVVPELHRRCKQLGPAAVRMLKLVCRALFHPHLYGARQRLARGAYAQVFRTKLPGLGARAPATVAVKLVDLPQSIHDQCAAYDLFGELSILESLRGEPGMCQMFDYGVDHECFYIVLQDYKCSLKAWREQHRGSLRHNLPLYFNIFQQVMDVCQAMTEQGIVHYDLKCDNLLLLPVPGTPSAEFWNPRSSTPPFTCVVADFGESKRYTSRDHAYTARNRGTEYIKSPEMLTVSNAVVKSRSNYDRRKNQGAGPPSDVWSAGCLLYELLVCEFLFYDPDWIRFFVRVTQPGQELLPRDRLATVKDFPAVLEFVEYVLVRDPLRRPTMSDARRRYMQIHQSAAAAVPGGPAPYAEGAANPAEIRGARGSSGAVNASSAARMSTAATSHATLNGFSVVTNPLGNSAASPVSVSLKAGAAYASPAGSVDWQDTPLKQVQAQEELQTWHIAPPAGLAESALHLARPAHLWNNVWLGREEAILDLGTLAELRITHVVACSVSADSAHGHQFPASGLPDPAGAASVSEALQWLQVCGIATWHVEIREEDGDTMNSREGSEAAYKGLAECIPPFLQYVWAALGRRDARVLVVGSSAGSMHQASATLGMAYLMVEQQCSVYEAFIHLANQRLAACPTVAHVARLCQWEAALHAERHQYLGCSRLSCVCGRWRAMLLKPLDSVRDRNPRPCSCGPEEDSNCPSQGGCGALLEALGQRHGYSGECVLWAYTDDEAIQFDPLCALSHSVEHLDRRRGKRPHSAGGSARTSSLASGGGIIQREVWQLYQCSACHCITHAVKESSTMPRKVAVVANWMYLCSKSH